MRSLCPFLLVGALAALPARAQDYEIRLHRPLHAGDKYELSTNGRLLQDLWMVQGQRPARSNHTEVSVQLEAVVTVLAVTNGKSMKQSIAISELDQTENGRFKILAGSGVTAVASIEDGKRAFTVDSHTPDREQLRALALAADFEIPGPDDDQVFGTKERRKIGDSWNLNTTLLADMVNGDGPIRARDFTGKATLSNVIRDTHGAVLVVTADARATAVIPELPPGMKLDSATVTLHASGRFPVDLALGKPEESTEMGFSVHAKGKSADGPETELNLHEVQSVTFKRIWIH